MSGFKPKGWHTVTPRLFVRDPVALVEFLKIAFGASCTPPDDDAPAEVIIGDSTLLVSSDAIRAATTSVLYVYVKDINDTYNRAVSAGATSIEEPNDLAYGDSARGGDGPLGKHVADCDSVGLTAALVVSVNQWAFQGSRRVGSMTLRRKHLRRRVIRCTVVGPVWGRPAQDYQWCRSTALRPFDWLRRARLRANDLHLGCLGGCRIPAAQYEQKDDHGHDDHQDNNEGDQDHEERPPGRLVVQGLANTNHHGHELPQERCQSNEPPDHRNEDEYVQKSGGLRETCHPAPAAPSPPRYREPSVSSLLRSRSPEPKWPSQPLPVPRRVPPHRGG